MSEDKGPAFDDTENMGTVRVEPPSLSAPAGSGEGCEANLIIIAHPTGELLGRRFRLIPGASAEIGRDPAADVSLSEVQSVSRRHAVVRHDGTHIMLEDCGSTNGTWIDGRQVAEKVTLASGARFQVGDVHFKLLHERDLEHAYHEAIYDLTIRDSLTGVANRRRFEEHGRHECIRARRHGRPLALVLFDIDRFKLVNDQHGHLVGDRVLVRLARTVVEALEPEQLVARIGGDEFAVLCEETDEEGARALARRLRERLAEVNHPDLGTVTCSFGVAAFVPEMKELADLVQAADEALYRSKHTGRDRVSVHGSSP